MAATVERRLRYDFAVYDSEGRISALVQVKRRFGTNVPWARMWHATLVERMAAPAETNVLLVAPDRIYAWLPGADGSADPDWAIDAEPWLGPYFARLKIPAREVDPRVFEEIVGLWLRDVVHGEPRDPGDPGSSRDMLDALRGGEVVEQLAA